MAKIAVQYLRRAKEMLCNNALYPDLYGHYREAKFTQTKHHWWWKANRVFSQLEVTRNHTGMFVAACCERQVVFRTKGTSYSFNIYAEVPCHPQGLHSWKMFRWQIKGILGN
jgi:hypothetical protein